MTIALCLNCGEMKFGALSECPACKKGPFFDGDIHKAYDISFSDWFLSIEQMEECGRVIKEIHTQESDDNICFWAFILFISKNNPDSTPVPFDPEFKLVLEEILSRCKLPVPNENLDTQLDNNFRGENMSEEEKIDQLRQNYLDKGPFRLDPYCDIGLFTSEEISDLLKYGRWFEALAKGQVPLVTDKQKEFVESLKKGVEPKSKYARLWYRYLEATKPPF